MTTGRTYRPYGAMRRRAEYLKERAEKACREIGHDFTTDPNVCRRCGAGKEQ